MTSRPSTIAMRVRFTNPQRVEYVSPTPTATCTRGKTIMSHGPPCRMAVEYQKIKNESHAMQKNTMKSSVG